MLDCYRILDLSDERGQMAGAILAGLGAEVILVEPPDGSHSRRVGPWLGHDRHRQHSLSHWVHNRGKRSVVLDLAHSEPDRDELRRLADGADVLIESATPGDMTSLGLGYEDVAGPQSGAGVRLDLTLRPGRPQGPLARHRSHRLGVGHGPRPHRGRRPGTRTHQPPPGLPPCRSGRRRGCAPRPL